ncbi:MAG: flippase [Liquorilactobacillus ghanensis]|uniref:flippase n=1 Tax=Liquorilactobacillus ghanensis TaxID=399370 RepID=UPI0039ECF9D4
MNNFKIHSVAYNFIMNIILKISMFIFPLITFPYVSRVLGAEANGKIAFATSVVSYFSLMASMGIPSYGVRKCAEVRDNVEKLNRTVRELLILNSIFVVVTYLLFFLILFLVPKFRDNLILFLIMSLTIAFNAFGVDWFYQAIEQYDYITIRNIIFKILSVVLMIGFVSSPKDYILYAGITVIGTVGSNILNLIRLNKYVNFKYHGPYNYRQHLKPIVLLFVYNATTTIFTNLDQVLLGFMSGNKEVGYYAAVVKIKNILVSVITALGSVMLPRVSYYLGKKNKEKFIVLIKESFNFILVSSVPVIIFFILESRNIILILAGAKYLPAISILNLTMPAVLFIGLSSVTAWQLLLPLKMEKYTVVGAVVGSIVDLVTCIIFIPLYGGNGAAFGASLAEFSVLVVHIFVLRKIIKVTFDFTELFKIILSGVSSLILTFYLKEIIVIPNKLFLSMLLVAVIYFVLYMVMLFFTRERLFNKFFLSKICSILKGGSVK